ncbi:MAG: glucosamine-6-phosphate deaminase [Bdellovibrionales bacterium]|nr:glucosamine-6-phosphate deaminase [Bdellovibrionales bacterium]
MKIHVFSDLRLLYLEAANFVAKKIMAKPKLCMGLAAGNTPTRLYENLIELYQQKQLSFSSVTTFNLDEFYGLASSSSSSFTHYIYDTFLKNIDSKKNHSYSLDGLRTDHERHCEEYEDKIRSSGGIDLQILGLGNNGHIAFNEPGSEKNSKTRLIDLSVASRNANQNRFKGPVPEQALTMGIQTISDAKTIVLLATGDSKSQAVKQLVEGSDSNEWPCIYLQKHPDLHCFLDAKAAKLLTKS